MLTTNFINTLTYTNRYWSTIQNGTLNLCSHFILGSLWHSSNQLIKLIENWFCAVMHARILYVWQSPNFFLHPRDKLQWAGEVPHSLCREQHIPSGHLPSSGPQLITLSPAMENFKSTYYECYMWFLQNNHTCFDGMKSESSNQQENDERRQLHSRSCWRFLFNWTVILVGPLIYKFLPLRVSSC